MDVVPSPKSQDHESMLPLLMVLVSLNCTFTESPVAVVGVAVKQESIYA